MRKKSPHLHASSSSNDGGEGGIDSLRSPCGQPTHCVPGLSNWLRQLSTPGRGFSSPQRECDIRKKSPHLHASSSLNDGGEGGIDSLRSPCGQPTHCVPGLSNWLRQLSTPGRGFSSPQRECDIRKKSPHLHASSSLNDGGEGGIDSLRSPCGQPTHCVPGLSNWLRQLSTPGRGFSSPQRECDIRKKSPHLHASSSLNDGGEGGIRTPDTLPYTHFPGVLLQPLGHLTTLSSRCCRDGR